MAAHTEFQETPLYLAAAEEEHEADFRLLLEHGADIKARARRLDTTEQCCTRAATVGENEAIVSLLLERGFDPKARDGGGGQTQLEGIDQELELKLRRDGTSFSVTSAG
jgi:ankyrin repeat protein